MRNFAVLVPAVLASCATAPAAGPSGTCRSDGLAAFAGREVTTEVGAELLRASGARTIRWVQPGMMVTMEYSQERVTIWLAPGNRIERVSCG